MSELHDLHQEWQNLQNQLDHLKSVEGGFSKAKRGIVTMPDGRKVFLKIGLDKDTKEWAKKEIAVYRFLENHHYLEAPRLLAVSNDETAFAIEAYTSEDGWDWKKNWDEERLRATLKAMEDLSKIELDDSESTFFSIDNFNQSINGWVNLLSSKEKRDILERKLNKIGADDILEKINYKDEAERSKTFQFKNDTLVHYDMRSDNCAWNSAQKKVKIVDWNWAQLGDKDIELAAFLTHVQESGYDLPVEFSKQLNPAAFQWVAGYLFDHAVKPMWKDGPEDLRDFQLSNGVTAFRLAEKLYKIN